MASARTSVDIDKEILKEVKIYCANNDMSIKEFIVTAVKEKLNK